MGIAPPLHSAFAHASSIQTAPYETPSYTAQHFCKWPSQKSDLDSLESCVLWHPPGEHYKILLTSRITAGKKYARWSLRLLRGIQKPLTHADALALARKLHWINGQAG
jgi:hypothetical protein